MKKFLLFTLLLILYASLQALAQEIPNATERPELITDRPDQTESAAIVPRGFVQFENGPYLILDENKRE